MNILYLTTHLNKGGIASYITCLAIALKKRGHTFVVASSGGDNETILMQHGIEHMYIPIATKNELSPRLVSSYSILQRYLLAHPVDLIHAHTRVTQVLATFLAKKNALPLVTTCHGFFRPRLHRRLFSCWGNAVIAISEPVKQHLMRDFGVKEKNISLIHSGVDIARLPIVSAQERAARKQEIGLKQNNFIVGSACRFSTVKGLEYLIQAIPHVLQQESAVQFLLVGYGKDESRLRALAKRLSLGDELIFYQPKRAIEAYLDAMDLFVVPSLQEGLGISILEAQAKQIPVIASHVGGIPDIIEHRVHGFLVKPKDPAALAQAIIRLLHEAPLREYIKQNAFRRVTQDFTLMQMVDKTEQLYARFLSEGKHAL